MLGVISSRMKEKSFNSTSAAAEQTHNLTNSGEQKTIIAKPNANEETSKNYITLLDLDEQKQVSNKKQATSKPELLQPKDEPTCSTMMTAPGSSAFGNRLKLYDLLPFKVCNSNSSSADYLSLGISPDHKRIESYITRDFGQLSAKVSPQNKASDKTVIMKEITAFIQNNRCSQCLCQECTCPPQDPSSNIMVLDNSKRKIEFSSPSMSSYKIGAIYSQPSLLNNSRSITESDYTRYYLNQAAETSSSRRKRKSSSGNSKSVVGRTGNKVKSTERTCGKCGLVFSTHREVLLHSRTHTEKTKEFGCHLCGKYFSQRTTLKQHLILHSGEKNFVCQSCGKRFALKIYLKTHHKSCFGLKCT